MNTDLVGLIFTRLQEKDQISLSTTTSFLFRILNITKLTQTYKLTPEILERKSIIQNEYLWTDLKLLDINYNRMIRKIPGFLIDNLISLSIQGTSSEMKYAGINHLHKLKILNVSGNPYIKKIPPNLNNTLIELSAMGNSGLSEKSIANLHKLKILNVNGNSKFTTKSFKRR